MICTKDIAYLIKTRIPDSRTICLFNQVCRAANACNVQILPNTKLHGLWRHYYKDGMIASEGTYRDGKRHGLWKCYYRNGQLESSRHFKNNKLHGVRKIYCGSGQLYLESNFQNGIKIS